VTTRILGLSCFFHDSSVALIVDGEVVFAISEERLSRRKHDSAFPALATGQLLGQADASIHDISEIAFYENPDKKYKRMVRSILMDWPNSWDAFRNFLPLYMQRKANLLPELRQTLGFKHPMTTRDHHRAHAASAFYTSPFERSLVVTVDGVGEMDTASVFLGEGNQLRKVKSVEYPHSLGLFYSVFTDYLGFEVNEGEYKVMGLAPYGAPTMKDKILGKILHLNEDGSFGLNLKFFNFSSGTRHYRDSLVDHLGIPPRQSGGALDQVHCDLAASVQAVLEDALLGMFGALQKEFGISDFCYAGGVALNCTANARLIRELGIRLHIQPAAGDAGGALGAALDAYVPHVGERELYRPKFTPYLGCAYNDKIIELSLSYGDVDYEKVENVAEELAEVLADGKVVAILHGREEWGPRALGARSILASPAVPGMKDTLNSKIKFREEFRPFAPVIMEEHYGEYFETLGMEASPYMLFTHQVHKPESIPAVTHDNNTSRVQTVNREQNAYLYSILEAFKRRTGLPVLINTSFNLRGEPIVSSPSDALKTFRNSGIDVLAMENYLVHRSEQVWAEGQHSRD
jgi:carbamoyltransferase